MILGVPKETVAGERRVAIAPQSVAAFIKGGIDVVVESGAGEAAGFPDAAYVEQQARIAGTAEVYAADILACVRVGADAPYKKDQIVIGFSDPLGDKALTQSVAESRPVQ
jgi:NAD(P) transhydrogenase subunit alpha